jgi:general stress protein 26
MAEQPARSEALAKLWSLVKDVRVAMLTTWDGHRLRSRPMHGFQDMFQGELLFYTRIETGKTREVMRYDQVNLAYADPQAQVYVSISGVADVVVDPAILRKHWSSGVAAWFPDGLDDPDLALIKVGVEEAAYWDMTTSRMRYLLEVGRANLTGREPDLGEHGSVSLDQGFRRPVE